MHFTPLRRSVFLRSETLQKIHCKLYYDVFFVSGAEQISRFLMVGGGNGTRKWGNTKGKKDSGSMKEKHDALLTVCELGRIGDIVASEPVYRYLKQLYPDRKLRWYTKADYADLLRFSPAVDEVVAVRDAEEYLLEKKESSSWNDQLRIEFHFSRSLRGFIGFIKFVEFIGSNAIIFSEGEERQKQQKRFSRHFPEPPGTVFLCRRTFRSG